MIEWALSLSTVAWLRKDLLLVANDETRPSATPPLYMTTSTKPRNRLDEANRQFMEYLSAAEIDLRRFIPARPGTKRPLGRWDTHPPEDVGRDSLIKTGDGLLVVDINDWDETPQPVRDLLVSMPTLTMQSPHASAGSSA